jgi:hypothetical protein
LKRCFAAAVLALLASAQAAPPPPAAPSSSALSLLPASVLRSQATRVSRALLPRFQPKGWLALVCAPAGCELRPVNLALGPVEAGVDDWSIEARNRKPPVRGEFTVVLLQGASLAAGTPVPTWFTLRTPRRVEDASAGSMGVRIDGSEGRRWQIVPRWNPQGEPRLSYHLEGSGSRPQVLGQIGMEAVERGVGPKDLLIWVGDLDGDGRIDLITRTSPSASAPGLVLWLSSRAAPGEPVGQAAELSSWLDVTEAEAC